MNPIDHLILGAPSYEAGLAYGKDCLGVEAKEGGRHGGLGTRNALVGLGPAQYLEILAPDADTDDRSPYRDGLERMPAPGLVGVMAACGDLDALADAGRAAGLQTPGPAPFSRTTPDGRTLNWRLLSFTRHPYGTAVPTFIDWAHTPNPAESLPADMSLAGFALAVQDVDGLRRVHEVLEFEADLERSETPHMKAVFTTPKGDVAIEGPILTFK